MTRLPPLLAIMALLVGLLSLVQMAPWTEQSMVGCSAIVTSTLESGVKVASRRTFLPGSSRRTSLTEPPVTVKAWFRTVV